MYEEICIEELKQDDIVNREQLLSKNSSYEEVQVADISPDRMKAVAVDDSQRSSKFFIESLP